MGYYVYRFINWDNDVVYVGKTVNLEQRFKQHEHLTDEVMKIEYIECPSEAEMNWKEIYYINLYKSENTTNVMSVYDGDVTVYDFQDVWNVYKVYSVINPDDTYKYKRYKRGMNVDRLYVVRYCSPYCFSREYYKGGGYHKDKNSSAPIINCTYNLPQSAIYSEKDAKQVAKILNQYLKEVFKITPSYCKNGCFAAVEFISEVSSSTSRVIKEDFKEWLKKLKGSSTVGMCIIPDSFDEHGIPDDDYNKFLYSLFY